MYSSLLDLKSDLPHCSVAVRMSYIMATIHTLLTHSSLLVRKIILYWHYLYYRKKLLEMAAHFFKVTFEKGMSTISRHLSLLSKRLEVFFKNVVSCYLLSFSLFAVTLGPILRWNHFWDSQSHNAHSEREVDLTRNYGYFESSRLGGEVERLLWWLRAGVGTKQMTFQWQFSNSGIHLFQVMTSGKYKKNFFVSSSASRVQQGNFTWCPEQAV